MQARSTDRLAHRARLVALAAAIAAAGVIASPTLRVVAKQVCDPLAHATSSGAALAALLFVAGSALVLMQRAPPADVARERKAGFLLLLALAIGNTANTLGHLAIARALGLPALVPLYQWQGADNTYSYLFHSHAGKAAFTSLLAPLANRLSLDIGQGWGPVVPAWVGLVCGGCLSIALIAYGWILPRLAGRFASSRWLLLLAGLATLNALKGIIDGGLLTYRALPSLLVLAALVTSPDISVLARRAPRWIGYGCLGLLAYALAWTALAPVDAQEPVTAFTDFLALLAIPALFAWRASAPTAPAVPAVPAARAVGAVRLAALLIAGLFVAGQYRDDAVQGTGLLWRPLPSDYRAWLIDPRSRQPRELPAAGRRPFDVYRAAGDDPLKPRHVMITRTPQAPVQSRFAFAVLVEEDLRVLSVDAGRAPLEGAFAAEGQLARNNYYCLLHGLSLQLRTAGLASFTLMPLRDRVDLTRLLARRAARDRRPDA